MNISNLFWSILLFELLKCVIFANPSTPNYYPLYTGYPPISTASVYEQDVSASILAGATSYNIPLYFEPNWTSSDPKVGVLLIHGYGAGPLQNLEIQKWWYEHGIASYAIRTGGHGISLSVLKKSNIEDWERSIEGPLAFLQQRCETVFIYGLSTGAPLAIHTVVTHPNIAGLMLQAPIIKSHDPRYYYFGAVVGVVEFLGIDTGEVYIDGDKESMHYWIPYCVFRGVYQVHRSAALAMRELPKLKVPVLNLASRIDTTADPQSNDIIARRSQAPWTRTYWFGTTHTPLILPNITIYRETFKYMSAVTIGSKMPTFEIATDSIQVQDWNRSPSFGIDDSARVNWQLDGHLSGSIGLFGNPWDGQVGPVLENGSAGIGVWQDRVDHKLTPSFGTYFKVSTFDLPLRLTAVGGVYYPFLWQWTGFAEWNVDRLKWGTRVPFVSEIQDSIVFIPELSLSNGAVDFGLNVLFFQGLLLKVDYIFDRGIAFSLAL